MITYDDVNLGIIIGQFHFVQIPSKMELLNSLLSYQIMLVNSYKIAKVVCILLTPIIKTYQYRQVSILRFMGYFTINLQHVNVTIFLQKQFLVIFSSSFAI